MVPPRIALQQRLIYHTHTKGGVREKTNHLATPAAGKAPLVVYPEISLLLIKLPPLETGAKSISGVPSPKGLCSLAEEDARRSWEDNYLFV